MVGARVDWKLHDTPQALAEALAARVAGELAAATAARGRALLAVSGGSTPGLFFRELSQADIDWAKVTVTLVDERMVAPGHPRSNERLVRENLLRDRAGAACFVGLYREGLAPPQAAQEAGNALAPLLPLDAAILGMGTDGHTASFFPDATALGVLLDPASPAVVAPVEAASAGEPRLTLTLPRLTGARFLALHIEGEEKRRILEGALEAGRRAPVTAVIAAAGRAVPVFWAPAEDETT